MYFKNTLRRLKFICISGYILALGCTQQPKEPQIFTLFGEAQGSTYTIKYIADKEVDIQSDIETLFKEIDLSMSTYKANSIISKINQGADSVAVDDYFKDVFRASEKVWEESHGAFDPTIGTMVNIWGFGPDHQLKVLDSAQIDSALQYVGLNKLRLSDDNTLYKETPGIKIDFNAIAQGYTVDVLSDYMQKKGFVDFIVEVGGEMKVLGKNTIADKPWIVGVDDPMQPKNERRLIAKIALEGKGMATSGNYRKVIVDSLTGAKYVHTIDPLTGYPRKTNVLSTTVLATSCMMADAYATTFMVMELDSTKVFLERHPNLDAMILYSDENHELRRFMTAGFEKRIVE